MSNKTIQNRIDGWWTGQRNSLTTDQDDYFSSNGLHCQWLRSHVADFHQTNGQDKKPDNLNSKPGDRPDDWRGLVGNRYDNLNFPCMMTINVYESPVGFGWWVTLEYWFEGNLNRRIDAFGPDADRWTHQWVQIAI